MDSVGGLFFVFGIEDTHIHIGDLFERRLIFVYRKIDVPKDVLPSAKLIARALALVAHRDSSAQRRDRQSMDLKCG